MTTTAPEKKIKAKQRHARVVAAYERWLARNPQAPIKRRIKTFNAISDSAFLEDQIRDTHGERRN